MINELTRTKRIQEADELYKAFNYSFIWLVNMVTQGLIHESEAGYLLTINNK